MQKYLELGDFKFADDFVGLTDAQFGKALQLVNAQFPGVYKLWSYLPPEQTRAKRELCINYLVAWQLTVLYPEASTNGAGTGAMPLAAKKVGPIQLKYRDTIRQGGSGALDMLTTNSYGLLALQMIQTAPENYQLYA